MDKDGSCTYYDAPGKRLYAWSAEAGVLAEVDVSKLGQTPQKWVLDSSFNAWVVSGTNLHYVAKNGKISTQKLPAEVADLAWDAHGFVLCYRTEEPFLEKRDYKNGAVIWSYGTKPKKPEGTPNILYRIAANDDENVVLASNGTFNTVLIEGKKGKPLNSPTFTFNGGPTPTILPEGRSLGPLVWWVGKQVTLSTLPGPSVPSLKNEGMLIVRTDYAASTIEIIPTELSEGFQLIGTTETQAVFIAAQGGLFYLAMK